MPGLGLQLFPTLGGSTGRFRVSGFRLRQPQWWARCFHVNPAGKPTDQEYPMNTVESQRVFGMMNLSTARRIRLRSNMRASDSAVGRAYPALLAALLLTACATTSEPKVQIREVKVPVVVKCATDPGPTPTYADTPDAMKAAADLFAKVQLLLAGRAQRDARVVELEAAVSGCR